LQILGMILGGTLSSVSLVLQTLTDGVDRERGAIEARIAKGGTRFEAFAPLILAPCAPPPCRSSMS
jgi:ABC-type iron transport system FetAB permease component